MLTKSLSTVRRSSGRLIVPHDSKYSSSSPRAFWMQQALQRDGHEEAPALEDDQTLDICIVGGGLTGLWTALQISGIEPSIRVGVVEADICGAGASGHDEAAAEGETETRPWGSFTVLDDVEGTRSNESSSGRKAPQLSAPRPAIRALVRRPGPGSG